MTDIDDDPEALRIVLSAPQLAAILKQATITEEDIQNNRLSTQLWGGLTVVGGVLEILGASALCVMPEPTLASKLGCIAFGAHGIDTVTTGARQLWTGVDTINLTHNGTAVLAKALRIHPSMADNIGLSIDLGVGIGIASALKATRVARITQGRIDLMMHEEKFIGGPGGHTFRKHVGKTEAELRERLGKDKRIPAASSFSNLSEANKAVNDVVRVNARRIEDWAKSAKKGNRLDLMQDFGREVGSGVIRATDKMTSMTKVTVRIKNSSHNGMSQYILTAYPDYL